MKKYLLLSALTAAICISACTKDKSIQQQVKVVKVSGSIKASAPPSYVAMTLTARQPGQNFDTYQATWNNCLIQVIGPLYWDVVKYPTAVDGIPVCAAAVTTGDGSSIILGFNSGSDGNVFSVCQTTAGTINFAAFRHDLEAYWSAVDQVAQGFTPTASLANFVNDSYTSPSSVTNYTGKLIKTASGSGLAIATLSYPTPASSANTRPNLDLVITDPNSTTSYSLHGINGVFVSGIKGTYTGVDPNTTSNFTNAQNVSGISANYAEIDNFGTFRYWGTLTNPDGTIFPFNIVKSLD